MPEWAKMLELFRARQGYAAPQGYSYASPARTSGAGVAGVLHGGEAELFKQLEECVVQVRPPHETRRLRHEHRLRRKRRLRDASSRLQHEACVVTRTTRHAPLATCGNPKSDVQALDTTREP
eukprot:1982196-Pyramimonas_sp.AAC.2